MAQRIDAEAEALGEGFLRHPRLGADRADVEDFGLVGMKIGKKPLKCRIYFDVSSGRVRSHMTLSSPVRVEPFGWLAAAQDKLGPWPSRDTAPGFPVSRLGSTRTDWGATLHHLPKAQR